MFARITQHIIHHFKLSQHLLGLTPRVIKSLIMKFSPGQQDLVSNLPGYTAR